MIYHLFQWLSKEGWSFPGANLMSFISVRVLLALLFSLLVSIVYGKRVINLLKKNQIGETVRDLGLAG